MRARFVGVAMIAVAVSGAACGNSGSVPGGAVDAGGGGSPGDATVPDTGTASTPDASGSAPAQLSLSATKIDFGLTDCGGHAAGVQTLTLTNTGGAPLNWSTSLDSVLFFTITGPSSGTIASGQTAKITITPSAMPASASAGATTSATIALATNDSNAGVTFIPVTATASGATFVLTPQTADFGTSPVGVQAPDISLSMLNVGNAAAQVAFGAPSDADFTIVATAAAGTPQSVAPGAAVPGLTARFKPSNINPASTNSTLSFTGAVCGGATNVSAISMSGQGASGAASVSPGTLDFGAVNCGTTAPFAITTLFNSGNASYTWSAVLGKGAASAFTVTPASGTLFAGAQAQIFVTPKAIPQTSAITPDLYGDQLAITTSVAGDTSHVVTLDETAQGAILAVTTTPLGYGTLESFSGTAAQSLVVTNTGNVAANLQLSTGSESFAATSGTAPASGGTFTSSVSFTPAAIGPVADSVTIASTSPLCQPLPAPVAVSGAAKAGGATQVAFAGLGRHREGSSPTLVSGCVILPGGHVACWGDNSHGQIGNGTIGGSGGTLGSASLTVVPGLAGVTSIAAGGDFNCAVQAGLVSCWGNNMSTSGHLTGKLGFGGSQMSVPTVIPGVTNVTQVSLGHNMGCALQSGGTIMCWGVNARGNLGNGGSTNNEQIYLSPLTVSGITTATEIAVGGGGACALLADTSVQCWGRSDHGQLGTSGDSSLPVLLIPGVATSDDGGSDGGDDAGPFTTSVKAFGSKASEGVRCALQSDTTVSCWGNQGHGWTGITTGNQRGAQTAVTSVPGLSGVTQLSVGYGFACAVLQGGSVSCWGRDDFGQLGNGGTTDSATPVAVTGISNAVQVTAGDSGACALLATGSVTCWGNNGFTTSPTPATLPGF